MVDIKSFEKVTAQNYIHKEIKRRLNMKNTSHLPSKNLEIRYTK
jgi:hypothetical protein